MMIFKNREKQNEKFVESYRNSHPAEPEERILLSKRLYCPIDKMLRSVLVIGENDVEINESYVKPNLLQMSSSYMITDPNGELLKEFGTLLTKHGYNIKILNLGDMEYSDFYNPFHYVHDASDVNHLVECFMENTENGVKEDFWIKAEKLLYLACICYLKYHSSDVSKQNFANVANMVKSLAVDENNPNEKSELDKLFDGLPENSLARKYYQAFNQAAGKTREALIVSCLERLKPFMEDQVRTLTQTDTLQFEKMGEQKTALFLIPSSSRPDLHFFIPMLYMQAFSALCKNGELQKQITGTTKTKYHIHCLMNGFAKYGVVPNFDCALATLRLYNISASVMVQSVKQLEEIYKETYRVITGNFGSVVTVDDTNEETVEIFQGKKKYPPMKDFKNDFKEHPAYEELCNCEEFDISAWYRD